jgi:pimeloyl-ACP methyl ester carboxylesterase
MVFSEQWFETNGQRLHAMTAGTTANPLLLCLHGFPEYWAAWREVIPDLANHYFVVAPDQRGYNLSSKPDGVTAYDMKQLVADIAGIADQISPEKPFFLAGHDWGASVAYAYAFRNPGRLGVLFIVNGIHPYCFQSAILSDPEQRAASQYINRLRADDAEELLRANGFEKLFNMLSGFSSAEWMGEDERGGYLNAWTNSGALTAMLNWYRASPIVVPSPDAETASAPVLEIPEIVMQVKVPHLVVWGSQDAALRPSCLVGLERFTDRLEIRRVENAGHWILHERPTDVAGEFLQFTNRL